MSQFFKGRTIHHVLFKAGWLVSLALFWSISQLRFIATANSQIQSPSIINNEFLTRKSVIHTIETNCDEASVEENLQQFQEQISPELFSAVVNCGELSVPTLTEMLKSRDERLKVLAVIALGAIGSPSLVAMPQLLKLREATVCDIYVSAQNVDERDVLNALEKTFQGLGSEIQDWAEVLIKSLDSNSYLAAQALSNIGPVTDEVIPALIHALDSQDSRLATTAAEALGNISPVSPATDELIPALIHALDNGSAAAAKVLGNIGPVTDEVVPALVRALNDGSYSAAHALGKIGPVTDEVIPALIRALNHKLQYEDDVYGELVQRSAAEALGNISPVTDEVVPALIQALYNGSAPVPITQALGKIGPITDEVVPALIWEVGNGSFVASDILIEADLATDQELVPALIRALDSRVSNASSVAHALGNIGPVTDQVVPALIRTLEHEDEYRHLHKPAIEALGKIGPVTDNVVPALIHVLGRPGYYRDVKNSAAEALGKIGPINEEVIPALLQALNNNIPSAAQALGEIGPATEQVVPALIQALENENDYGYLHRSAVKALIKNRHGNYEDLPDLPAPSLPPALPSIAAEALGKIGPVTDEVVPALIRALDNGVSSADEALGKIGPVTDEVVPALIRALFRGSVPAAQALGEIGPENSAVAFALLQALENGLPDAYEILIKFNLATESQLVAVLMRALVKDSLSTYWIRTLLIESSLVTDKELVPALIQSLENENTSAAEILGEIGPITGEVVPALIRAVKSDNSDLKKSAINSISSMGTEANLAIPVMKQIFLDDQEEILIRLESIVILQSIGIPESIGIIENNMDLIKIIKAIAMIIEYPVLCAQSASANVRMASASRNNLPAMCQIPAVRAVIRWKCRN